MSTFEVTGSHGSLTVCNRTGYIVKTDLDGDEYEGITKFNVAEWKAAYPGEELNGSVDILDLGYWIDDGGYEPPAHEWRHEYRKEKPKMSHWVIKYPLGFWTGKEFGILSEAKVFSTSESEMHDAGELGTWIELPRWKSPKEREYDELFDRLLSKISEAQDKEDELRSLRKEIEKLRERVDSLGEFLSE